MRHLPVALLAILLGWFYATRSDSGIGVGRFAGAQDEAHYSNAAIRMAQRGEWMTPYFMDRFYLYKPPVVYWLSAASVKLTGVSADALRRPAKIVSVATLVLVFLLAGQGWAGLTAAAALAVSPLFGDLGARNMTDALLCFWIVLAAWLLARDLHFEQTLTWVAFGAVTGLAILTKSTAGLIPPMIAGVLWLIHRDVRTLVRILYSGAVALAVALAVAAPWFAYQYSVHPRWFWAEFVEIELLAYGAGSPPQYAEGSALRFYVEAFAAGALVLLLPAALGLVSLGKAVLRRDSSAVTVAAWIGVMVLAIAGFQYRNDTYLLPLLPAFAVVSAAGKASRLVVYLSIPLFLAMSAERPIGSSIAVREILGEYCELRRSNELVIVDAADSFHAAVLPLAKLRYAFPGEGQPAKGFALDFRSMGIVMPVAEFLDLDRHRPRYEAAMREWGLPDGAALATVVAFPTSADLQLLIESSPDRDFLLPEAHFERIHSPHHRRNQRFRAAGLLLGRDLPPRPALPWACRM